MSCQLTDLIGPQGQQWRECVRCRKIYAEAPPPDQQFCIGDPPPAIVETWNPSQPSRGLGDTIARVTSRLGIKPCGGCKRRQEQLNKMFPYNSKGEVEPENSP